MRKKTRAHPEGCAPVAALAAKEERMGKLLV